MSNQDDSDQRDLAWRVEEACLNAYPAAHTLLVAGWLVRISGGRARRTNSISPQQFTASDPHRVLAEAALLYERATQPLIARVPTLLKGLDAHLDARGFTPTEAETCTLHTAIGAQRAAVLGDVSLADQPSVAWLSTCYHLNAFTPPEADAYRRSIGLIASPVRYASTSIGGQIEAIAYGAICRDLLVIESVATSTAYRGKGLARQIIVALMNWARSLGVSGACLQVTAQNTPARRLYDQLGFSLDLYHYHYRQGPDRTA